MEKSYLTYHAKKEDEGRTVKEVLYEDLKLTSRKIRAVKQNEEGILLDGQRVRIREKLKAGQMLKVLLDDTDEKEEHLIPVPMDLDILYEDEYFIFLNKPSGMVCHPSRGHAADSLSNGIAYYFKEKGENSRIHLIGRLDKDTSGIVGIAKNSVAAQWIHELKEKKAYHKIYKALAAGEIMEDGSIDIPMKEYRDEKLGGLLKMRRADIESEQVQGKDAITHYKVIDNCKEYSLIELSLESGRMHQIRFHLSEIGHPLLGDSLYNTMECGRNLIARTALHAGSVFFRHPVSGAIVSINAKIPRDMYELMNQIDTKSCKRTGCNL